MARIDNVDFDRLIPLLESIQGDRSLRQFAADADVDHSTLVKIMRRKAAPGIGVLQRLTNPAAKPQGSVTILDLMDAAGFPVDKDKLMASAKAMADVFSAIKLPEVNVSGMASALSIIGKAASSLKESMDPAFTEYAKVQNRFKVLSIGIIISALADKGIHAQAGDTTQLETLGFRPDDYLTIPGQEITTWWFRFWRGNPEFEQQFPVTPDERASALIQPLITARPDPLRKTSVVVEDRTVYDALKRYAGRLSYRGNLSAILISTDEAEILDERTLATYVEDSRDPLEIL